MLECCRVYYRLGSGPALILSVFLSSYLVRFSLWTLPLSITVLRSSSPQLLFSTYLDSFLASPCCDTAPQPQLFVDTLQSTGQRTYYIKRLSCTTSKWFGLLDHLSHMTTPLFDCARHNDILSITIPYWRLSL